jgi:hypothetical protein
MKIHRNGQGTAHQGRKNMSKKTATGNLIGAGLLLLTVCGFGAANASSISVSGNPGLLRISSATAGSDLAPVSNATTTYDLHITSGTAKITAHINSAMPADTNLRMSLVAPTNSTSLGLVTLMPTDKNLVTGIPNGTNLIELGITYQFSASVSAGVISSSTKTVTLTVTAN